MLIFMNCGQRLVVYKNMIYDNLCSDTPLTFPFHTIFNFFQPVKWWAVEDCWIKLQIDFVFSTWEFKYTKGIKTLDIGRYRHITFSYQFCYSYYLSSNFIIFIKHSLYHQSFSTIFFFRSISIFNKCFHSFPW